TVRVGVDPVGLADPVLLPRSSLGVAGLGVLCPLLGAFGVETQALCLQPLLLRTELGLGEHLRVPTGLGPQFGGAFASLHVLLLTVAAHQRPRESGTGQDDHDRNDDPDDLMGVHIPTYPPSSGS